MINYRGFADLNDAILRSLSKFPKDVDFIVGIPRSGMLPANLLALYLNKPFVDLQSFLEGRVGTSGERGRLIDTAIHHKIIVIDDSVYSGGALRRAKDKIIHSSTVNEYEILYATVFIVDESTEGVDIYCECVKPPRVFQWNLFHHPDIIPHSCFDIDGVLCENPKIDDDGPAYMSHLVNARPLYIPSVEIDTLVTCRLEKYRKETETWLAQHHVKYRHLIMLDLPNKAARIKWNKHGTYKGLLYKKSDAILFVESSLREAKEILRISGKDVFCTENFQMLRYHVPTFSMRKAFGKVLRKLHMYNGVVSILKHLRRVAS